jgi:myo-inositol-1(or 4)-monophosphatase
MLSQLERSAFDSFEDGSWKVAALDGGAGQDEVEWIRLGLCFLLETVSKLRYLRFEDLDRQAAFKPDGSPFSQIEGEIENLLRKRLGRLAPEVNILGEESGGAVSSLGYSVAIDPVDGTWAFLNRAETFSTTLLILHDQQPVVGFIANPATGELAYSTTAGPARLIQLPMLAGAPSAYNLPLPTERNNSLLINLHPARNMGPVLAELATAWTKGEIRMLKATGGSPAWSLLDVAKSGCSYINLWSGEPARPYDLAAAFMLVRGAGGIVLDVSGKPADPVGLQGPFIAGIDRPLVERITGIVAKATGRSTGA